MPAAHWSWVPLAVAAALGLSRRRMAGGDGAEPVTARRRLTPEEAMAVEPTPNLVFSQALAGCTDREIADRFSLAEAEVAARYGAQLRSARAQRAFAIRRAQTELATGMTHGGGEPAGNGPMLMWLGRNELGQSHSPGITGIEEPSIPGEHAMIEDLTVAGG